MLNCYYIINNREQPAGGEEHAGFGIRLKWSRPRQAGRGSGSGRWCASVCAANVNRPPRLQPNTMKQAVCKSFHPHRGNSVNLAWQHAELTCGGVGGNVRVQYNVPWRRKCSADMKPPANNGLQNYEYCPAERQRRVRVRS